ncbi:MAG: ABC transporter ATP-binding protein, partial [Planctomycetota bacterium]
MKERLKHIAGIPRAVGLVWRSAPRWTVASVGIVIVQGLLPLAAIYVMKLIIDGVADGVASADKAEAFAQVGLFIGIAAGIAVLNSICQSLSNLVSEAQSQLVTDHVQEILHAKSVAVDLSYYENSKYYDTLHLAQKEAPYRPTRIVQDLIRVGRNTISLLAVAGLLFALHWGLALVLLASMIPTVLVRIKYARGRFAWRRRATETQRRSRYLNWILTGGRHAKEIRLFDLGPTFIRRFSELRDRLRGERLSIAARESAAELVALSVSALAVFGAVGFAAYRTVYGVLTVGGLVMYYQAFQRGQGFLHQTLGGIAGLYESSLFLSNFYEFLDLEKRVVDPARPRPVPRPMSSGIVFDHMTFRYPGSERNAVQDVSLDVRPGEVVALVGENGAGKTTLVKLLCR